MRIKNKHPKIALVVLAAGESKRMGSIKQILPWKNTTLLGHIIDNGLASNVDDIFVVLGANFDVISKEIIDKKIKTIFNSKWKQGMGTSIAAAIDFIDKNNLKFGAILVVLSDQPLINVEYYNKLINNYIESNKKIISSKTKRGPGVPALFDSKYFDALSKLDQDFGARKIILNNKSDLLVINSNEKMQDIDTFNTYELLYQKHGIFE